MMMIDHGRGLFWHVICQWASGFSCAWLRLEVGWPRALLAGPVCALVAVPVMTVPIPP